MTSRRYFSDMDRCNGRQCTSTETSDDTSHQDLVGARSGRLKSAADKYETRCNEETIDTTDSISNPASNERSYNGAQVVDGDNSTLVRGVDNSSVWKADANLCNKIG